MRRYIVAVFALCVGDDGGVVALRHALQRKFRNDFNRFPSFDHGSTPEPHSPLPLLLFIDTGLCAAFVFALYLPFRFIPVGFLPSRC